jgi:hypothetical protein
VIRFHGTQHTGCTRAEIVCGERAGGPSDANTPVLLPGCPHQQEYRLRCDELPCVALPNLKPHRGGSSEPAGTSTRVRLRCLETGTGCSDFCSNPLAMNRTRVLKLVALLSVSRSVKRPNITFPSPSAPTLQAGGSFGGAGLVRLIGRPRIQVSHGAAWFTEPQASTAIHMAAPVAQPRWVVQTARRPGKDPSRLAPGSHARKRDGRPDCNSGLLLFRRIKSYTPLNFPEPRSGLMPDSHNMRRGSRRVGHSHS